MSRAATPARLIASITFRISVLLPLSAADADLACVATPNENAARFGTESAAPEPITVIERTEVAVAADVSPAAPAAPPTKTTVRPPLPRAPAPPSA